MVLEMNASQVLEHIQINNMILAAAGDGVISGLEVSEKGAGANMSVDVATGSALINGTTYTESSIVNLVIEAAHATLHRKDLITYDPTTSNPVVTKGTNHAGGTGDPIYPPDIPAGDILLAIVEVAAAVTTITNSEITDCIVEVPSASTIGGLLDVVISSVADKEFLTYNSAGSNWINRTPAEAGIAALAGFTMAGDINMGDHQIYGMDDIKAYDTVGINIRRNDNSVAGQIGASGYFANADGILHMGSYKITNVSNPVSAQDAATKTWVENTAVIDADKVDGCDAGLGIGDAFKINSGSVTGGLYQFWSPGIVTTNPSTDGYQLTTHSTGNLATWAAASDLLFSDTHCPKCGKIFEDSDDLILHVIGHNEVGDILTIPMHLSCANQPKNTVTLKRKVFEDRHVLDELTGELVVQRVQKTVEKTVTKHKLKEGHIIDGVTGKAHTVDDKGKQGDAVHKLTDALEVTEETIEEPVYEDVEYRL